MARDSMYAKFALTVVLLVSLCGYVFIEHPMEREKVAFFQVANAFPSNQHGAPRVANPLVLLKQRKELKALLEGVGQENYYDQMIRVGIDRIQILSEATEQDRDECGVKPAHWRRIVKAASDRVRQEDDALVHPAVPTNIRLPEPTANPPATEKPAYTVKPIVRIKKISKPEVKPEAKPEIKEVKKEVKEVNKEVKTKPKSSASKPKAKNTASKAKAAKVEDGDEGDDTPAQPVSSNSRGKDRKGEPEKYLMISSLTAGFASGVRTQLLPFFALAAATERTAVLPAASFGIPAFRTTLVDTKQGFVPLSTFLDLRIIKRGMPCLKVITHDDWKQKMRNTVDSVLFLGKPGEIGTEDTSGAIEEERTADALSTCYEEFAETLQEQKKGEVAKEYWGGPWDVQGETHHVISTNKMKVGAVHCASTFVLRNGTKVLHASKGSFAHKKTVMMANFPGLVRDAFYWHSPNTEEGVKLFVDVPRNICNKWDGFNRWPTLSEEWRKVADKVVQKRFEGSPFSCVHIRGEKLVINAVKAGKFKLKAVQKSPYMKKCMEGVAKLIKRTMKGKSHLLLISDLNPETGSPSAAREKAFKAWMGDTQAFITKKVGKGEGFCDTEDSEEAHTSGPLPIRHALDIYPGNCAAGEAAICQMAESIVRFGKGSMGAFVAGENEAEAYMTCEDVFEASGISPP